MSLLKSLKLREFALEPDSRSGSGAAASSVLAQQRVQEPKMASQFPNFELDEEEDDDDDDHAKNLLEKITHVAEEKMKQAKKKKTEDMAMSTFKSCSSSITKSANAFNTHWEGKVDDIVHRLDRKAMEAKEGQEKLKTTKASVMEAIELHREKMKRLLHQLKEHEKDVMNIRDVHLKQTSVNELNRAKTSIEEKLVQLERYIQKVKKETNKSEDKYARVVEMVANVQMLGL